MIRFRYKSTNCHLVQSSDGGRLLAVDAGWPCSLREYVRGVSSMGRHFNQVAWAMVTHFHLDHAGLIGEFIARGIRCLVFENQEDAIDPMETMIVRTYGKYIPIVKGGLVRLRTEESRDYFQAAGIRAEVVVTPGHSPDGVTFISDAGEAVIGDLHPPGLVMTGDEASLRSWELIRQRRARYIYPGHAPVFEH